MVYVSNDMKVIQRAGLEVESIEASWVEVKVAKMQKLVCNVYRPPDAKVERLDGLAGMIEYDVQEGKIVVGMGDFNLNMLHSNFQACRLGTVRAK